VQEVTESLVNANDYSFTIAFRYLVAAEHDVLVSGLCLPLQQCKQKYQ